MATVPVVDRPREKLARVGAAALGDNELVALVLGTGTRSRGALVVAQDVIAMAGGVPGQPDPDTPQPTEPGSPTIPDEPPPSPVV